MVVPCARPAPLSDHPSTAARNSRNPSRQAASGHFLHWSPEGDFHRSRDGDLHAATLHANLELAGCDSSRPHRGGRDRAGRRSRGGGRSDPSLPDLRLQGSAVEYASDLDVGTVSEGRVNRNFWPDLVDELGLPHIGKDYRVGISNRHGMDDRASGPTEIQSLVRVQGSRVEANGLGSVGGAGPSPPRHRTGFAPEGPNT